MSAAAEQQALAGVFTRTASTTAGTWNDEARTVDVIVSSGAPVSRYSWGEGNFTEVLAITPDAIDLSRADGMAVLDSHNPYSMETRIGTVVAGSMRVAGGNLVATVKLSRNALGESLAQDLSDGHPFSVSVGYRIDRYEWSEGGAEEVPTLTATRWTPMEISAVAIPADPAARTRNFEGPEMSQTPENRGRAAPGLDPATSAERRRVTELRSIAALARADVSEETLSRAIDTGVTADAFRAQVLEAMVRRQEATEIFPHASPRGVGTNERTAEFASRLVEVLAGRAANGGEIAREFLEAGGVRSAGMSDREVGRVLMGGNRSIWNGGTRAMHTSGDFSLLVGKAAANVLLERFAASPSVLKRFSRLRNAVDFRDVRFYRPGEAPALLKVNEHGEIKSGTMSEEGNGFRVETFARMFALTFQASVNDGLGAFADFLATFAESAIRLEGDLFAQLLDGDGPRLDDGQPLFHASHGNLATTGTALSIETLDAAVIAMRTQKNVGGGGLAGTTPAAIVVGPALELKAKQLVAQVQATNRADINPHALDVVVEDRLGGDFRGWFVLANPASRPAFIHGGLDGHNGPEVDSKEGWDVLGTEFRVVHHFGAGVHDYRAAYKNPGVA